MAEMVKVVCDGPQCDQVLWTLPIKGVKNVCTEECAHAIREHTAYEATIKTSRRQVEMIRLAKQQHPFEADRVRMCGICHRILEDVWDLTNPSKPSVYQHSIQDVRAMTRANQGHQPAPVPVDMNVLLTRCDFCNVDLVKTENWTVPSADFHMAGAHWSRGDWQACPVCVQLIADRRWAKLVNRTAGLYKQNTGNEPPSRVVIETWYMRLRHAMLGPPYLEEPGHY